MAEIRRTPQAEIDLETILADLDQKNPRAAERYAADFAAKAQLLAQFPEMGRLRPELIANVRSVLVSPYVLFYRFQNDIVQIIRILPGMRDLRTILRDEADQ